MDSFGETLRARGHVFGLDIGFGLARARGSYRMA
jgi:hypothetical protein